MNTATIAGNQAQLWYKDLFADVPTILFFDKFMGEGPNNPIQIVRDLKKGPGDKITFPLTTKLSGDGIVGDAEAEGNEEEILSFSFSMYIDQLREPVRLKGKMDERKAAYNLRTDAKEKLKIWWAERIDREIIYKLTGQTDKTFANTPTAASSARKIFAGGQSAESGLTAGMKFDTKVIDAAKQKALLASPKIRPIRMADKAFKGEEMYVILVHPYQATDLRNDPVWNQAQRDANVRGSDNPILSGALGVYNGCIIHQHELMYTGTDGAASAATARAILMGQQAGVFAEGQDLEWVEKSFDFGNKWAICAGRIFGVQKPVFNSEDYGIITISTAAAAASTA
jgi:N4-gp56 family major capsid protein